MQLLPIAPSAAEGEEFSRVTLEVEKTLFDVFPPKYWSPYPFVDTQAHYSHLREITRAVRTGLHALVEYYFDDTDEILQRILPLDPRIRSLLLKLQPLRRNTYRLGSWRPDFVIDTEQVPRLCEINARFAFNAYFASYIGNEVMQRLQYLRTMPAQPFHHLEEIESKFCNLFSKGKSIGILLGREAGWDVHLFAKKMRDRGYNIRFVKPDQLGLDANGSLVDAQGPLEEIAMELHQDEILSLSDDLILAVGSRTVINDLWTIFLVHDKRALAVLSDQQFQEKYVPSAAERLLLRRHIIPSKTFAQFKAEDPTVELLRSQRGNWLIKPNLLGKGKGFLFGKSFTDEEWSNILASEVADTYIIQPVIHQKVFDILPPTGTDPVPMHVVGLLLCLNDHFIAPGIYRASSVNNLIVNVAGGQSCILLPALLSTPWMLTSETVEDPTALESRFVAKFREELVFNMPSAGKADQLSLQSATNAGESVASTIARIDGALKADGIALVQGLNFEDQSLAEDKGANERLNHQLVDFLSTFGILNNHSATQAAIWDVRPTKESGARSHDAREFPMHTDSSFENPPPRFIALYVVKQDANGGGLSRLIYGELLLRSLSLATLRCLRKTKFRFAVPQEFRKDPAVNYTDGPILSATGRWRYRSEIIIRDNLTPEQVSALAELDAALGNPHLCMTTRLPEKGLLLLDNGRWFHARSKIKDPARWLKRARFHDFSPEDIGYDFDRQETTVGGGWSRETSAGTMLGSRQQSSAL
jgi:hypothetical protein